MLTCGWRLAGSIFQRHGFRRSQVRRFLSRKSYESTAVECILTQSTAWYPCSSLDRKYTSAFKFNPFRNALKCRHVNTRAFDQGTFSVVTYSAELLRDRRNRRSGLVAVKVRHDPLLLHASKKKSSSQNNCDFNNVLLVFMENLPGTKFTELVSRVTQFIRFAFCLREEVRC